MKRILMLNYEFPPLGGGGGVAAKKLAVGFIKLGYKIDYVTTWFKGLSEFEIVEGIQVHRVKVINRRELPTASLFSLVSFPFLAYKKANELCKENEYDFINTHFAIPTGPLGVWMSRKYKIKNILNIHGGDVYDPTKKLSPHKKWYLRKIVNWVLNNSDVLVAQSTNTKNNINNYYHHKKSVNIIPLPYEPFLFNKASRKELDLDENIFYTISIGRLVKRKGFDFLLNSISKLGSKDTHALIVGDGPEKENLQKLVRELGIEDQVHFLGSIPEEKKFQFLSNSDIYILSSIHEGYGIVLQEAMQVGLPIISTNNGGQVDLIKEGENGFLINFGDENSLVERIGEFYKNRELFKEVSQMNIKKISRFFSTHICEEYLKLSI